MEAKNDKLNQPDEQIGNEDENNLPGYPVYPASDDIYNNYQEEKDINPEDILRMKERIEKYKVGKTNEKDYFDDLSDNDMDIPGAELDDEQENIGSEDEENNYYSLGGDNHEDLEEDKSEL